MKFKTAYEKVKMFERRQEDILITLTCKYGKLYVLSPPRLSRCLDTAKNLGEIFHPVDEKSMVVENSETKALVKEYIKLRDKKNELFKKEVN